MAHRQMAQTQMAQAPNIGDAMEHFEAALRGLEGRLANLTQSAADAQSLGGEAKALREDRARLAEELEQVRAKAADLANANSKASEQIESAMTRIRSVLGE